jgi:hypothetical protein
MVPKPPLHLNYGFHNSIPDVPYLQVSVFIPYGARNRITRQRYISRVDEIQQLCRSPWRTRRHLTVQKLLVTNVECGCSICMYDRYQLLRKHEEEQKRQSCRCLVEKVMPEPQPWFTKAHITLVPNIPDAHHRPSLSIYFRIHSRLLQ